MYAKRNLRSINDVRVALFWQSNVPCRRANPLQKIRCNDPRLLPPCKAELLENIKRINYVASMWKNAHLQNPVRFKPDGNGWVLDNGRYNLRWFFDNQIPEEICVEMIASDKEIDTDDDGSAFHSSSDDSHCNVYP